MERNLNSELKQQADCAIFMIKKYINDEKINYEDLRIKAEKIINSLQGNIPYNLQKVPFDFDDNNKSPELFRLVQDKTYTGMPPIDKVKNLW